MMNLKKWILPGAVLISLLFVGSLEAASRIKDVAAFEGVRDNQLFGYGLVVGLKGSGDGTQVTFFHANRGQHAGAQRRYD